ncbi:hypothetical protein TGPRC2_295080 [Toxoplasma gondii TgCatPRC2]|uniref:Uncharacterized protein n=11 Tax=Toxoplasma gondii TaxID=5811 RepID=A0A125YZ31_TOXGV|nr:hypothetical protein TGME49_295080 [Toxoplasma gondii ME49]EPR57724.1 hypothetical protein TGGT1_295080 [Toxoplasma gondii GT1]ESS29164.1 hypothetical protein TGVEG_295080 [Toxoplasma gondii VEG]KAF4646227.1 hypothetical protein TGRH88_020140 [Toxoplasma gondii]KFG35263.1 hypothetical protein TGP89_295080 [Toxoplasma gondii p89]KFG37276.1 hypothetical protein TGDOM2_295080 [Toxoplasma gondii GAB2-2007-GAL-DOM2]KFG46544.1 hypothetical protein TGFOU_295080 [Toxoplasma gondii FOU]KFH14226.1 |eukprot:XP_018638556.1 hypothetical protein TGME49_295080 [Toxoplasma gondii ME49]
MLASTATTRRDKRERDSRAALCRRYSHPSCLCRHVVTTSRVFSGAALCLRLPSPPLPLLSGGSISVSNPRILGNSLLPFPSSVQHLFRALSTSLRDSSPAHQANAAKEKPEACTADRASRGADASATQETEKEKEKALVMPKGGERETGSVSPEGMTSENVKSQAEGSQGDNGVLLVDKTSPQAVAHALRKLCRHSRRQLLLDDSPLPRAPQTPKQQNCEESSERGRRTVET